MSMKIVMDFRKYDGVIGGVERGVLNITKCIASNGHQVVLLPKEGRLNDVKEQVKGYPNITLIPLQVRTHVMSVKNAYLDSVTIQEIARAEKADIIHFPYNWSFPFRKRVPCILTVHDVIPLTFREAMGFFTNHFLYRPGIRTATRLNDVIATVSEFSKKDIGLKLGVPETKIKVIPNGLRQPYAANQNLEAELVAQYGLKKGFILYVGGIHERKNVPGLVRAFSKLVHTSGFEGRLLITGNVSGAPYQVKMKKLCDAAVREAGMEKRVIFTGFVSDQELDTLMRLAVFLVYPSLYEGFGIPILEAMRVGTPVITSNLTAMPEVAGDAALMVNPRQVDDIAFAMSRLLQDDELRRELVRKGEERAVSFSWEKSAEEYLRLYKEISA
jgi:glycosyltransferase involved in cell wall biosynthesis